MKNKIFRTVSIFLCSALILGTLGAVVYANKGEDNKTQEAETVIAEETAENTEKASKNETVYVLADANGNIDKIIVSDWIKNSIATNSLKDETALENIQNVKGEEKLTIDSNGAKVWDAKGNDIYYRGNIEKEIPVNITVSYKLDGKSVGPDEIKGKSGKVEIRFDYKNNQFAETEINGKTEKINIPFAMLTGVILDNSKFRNVEITNGKILNDGNRTALIGLAFPGLQSNLKLDKSKIDIPDYFEIKADVKDFELTTTMTVATNDIFSNIDTKEFNTSDDLNDALKKMSDSMKQLIDGSSALYGGLETLLTKSQTLIDGINQLASGAEQLNSSVGELDKGVGSLKEGIDTLNSGLNKLTDNNESLKSGAEQIFNSLLSTANGQIKDAGLDVPQLTKDNYGKVLDSAVNGLSDENLEKLARQQVTALVEKSRPLIIKAVTDKVNLQVKEKVIKTATGLSSADYEKAVAAGAISKENQAKINAAIKVQMESAQIKAIIDENVNNTVKAKIEESMSSDTVKATIEKGKEGRKSLEDLKSSLDSFSQFYAGLNAYTDGVKSAADGSNQLNGGAAALKDGTEKLTDGVNTLYNGIIQIKNGTPALVEGITQLKDGSMTLNSGLKEFNSQGIQKIINAVDGDLNSLLTRIKATVNVSKQYKSFSGISDEMDGNVKFIYKTESVKLK